MPVVVEDVHVRTRDYALDFLLLADLSGEAVFRGLTDLEFSAWELPEAGKLLARLPPRNQNKITTSGNGGGDDAWGDPSNSPRSGLPSTSVAYGGITVDGPGEITDPRRLVSDGRAAVIRGGDRLVR